METGTRRSAEPLEESYFAGSLLLPRILSQYSTALFVTVLVLFLPRESLGHRIEGPSLPMNLFSIPNFPCPVPYGPSEDEGGYGYKDRVELD